MTEEMKIDCSTEMLEPIYMMFLLVLSLIAHKVTE